MSGAGAPARAAADRACLERGLAELKLDPGAVARQRLLQHAALIRHWSRSFNLVSGGDLDALIARHTLDSLAIHPFLAGTTLLDVGSGAGFPGLPLAIALDHLEVTLLDASGKRARFLNHAVRELALENVRVIHARTESCGLSPAFDTLCSRAFASLKGFALAVRPLAGPASRVLAIKGRFPARELDELPDWVTVESVSQYHVPLSESERHVVIMTLLPEPATAAV